jgi:UDP-N-acetylglucosamine 2-epimerase (non-hydrolysing)
LKRILIIVGTRPEAIKLIPVFLALRNQYIVQLISTGQHKEMLQQIFDFFEIKPHWELNIMQPNQSLAQVTSLLFSELNKTMGPEKINLVIVQGDTTSAMVAAMVAYYHRIPVAHVEAGLRSKNKYAPFPEEINRSVISQIADLNFAPTSEAAGNLMGHPNVHVVGNTIIDSLLLTMDKIKMQNHYADRFSSLLQRDKDLILVTAHRRESFGEGISNICRAIQILSTKYPQLQFLFPVHLNPNVKEKVEEILGGISSIKLVEPVHYSDMIFLMTRARIILTDSGGIQEEAPFLGIPLIVMRDVTERPEGIEAGCAVLGGTKTEGIVSAFENIHLNPGLYEAMKNAGSPYGDGRSSARIAEIISDFL